MAAAAAGPEAGSGKGKRKRSLSEDDVYLLLHRYAPGTILTVLQEVAQHAEGRRIDWRAVVKKSATGITSAREYQMLWRHFAYHDDLDENVDAGDQPLGDDSDLECELEPVPNPSKEALSEVSALAKALISGSSREQASGHRVNLDASALNSPNEKIVRVPSDKQLGQSHRQTNVAGPVSNLKQASHLGQAAGPLDANGPPKKKKKPKAWSKEEDADLTAGVQKYGEGNWVDILHKCNFDNTRTADQLSQRWSLICKRPGGSIKPVSARHVTTASYEARKLANNASLMAAGPVRASTLRSGAPQQIIQHTSTAFAHMIPEVRSATAPSPAPSPAPTLPVPASIPVPVARPPLTVRVQSPLPQGQQAPAQAAPPKVSNASNKARKKQATQQNHTISTSSIQAAAIAAGGRLATASTAANFLKVAQAKSAMHKRPQVTKSSTSSKAQVIVVEPGTQPGVVQHLEPPNASAPKSGPAVVTMHTTEQVHVSEVAAVNPPGPSAGAHSSGTKKALGTTPVPASCDSEEKDDDSNFCSITIDDLFPEDAKQPETIDLKENQPETVDFKAKQEETVEPKVKQPETVDTKAKHPETPDPKAKQTETADPKAKVDSSTVKFEMVDSKDKDMLEFDQFVASQGGSVNTDHMEKSKTAKSASQTQGLVGSQKKPLKLGPAVGNVNPVSAGVPATGKKTKTPAQHLATPAPAGTPRSIVGTVNANVPNKTVVRKAAAPTPAPAGGQTPLPKKNTVNIKGNQMIPSNAAVGSGLPASSQASVVNGASRVNPPSRSQAIVLANGTARSNSPSGSKASAVVNVGSKVNPPSNAPASASVDSASKANPPSTSQANKAKPPPASQ